MTHGGGGAMDKSTATGQDVFGLAELLFDDTTLPYQSTGDAGATLLARAERYRLPEVVRRVAVSDRATVDRERMNVPLDRHDLWESDFFQPFQLLRDAVGGDAAAAQALAPMLAFGFLSEVNSYTHRSPDVMLSTAQSYRPGDFGEQYHAWQATLDEEAVVFTTHPTNEPEVGTEWPDSDGCWTGTGSMPRSAQQATAAIHQYAPQFPAPGPDGLLSQFEHPPLTHAHFPRERFDEVVADGHRTLDFEAGERRARGPRPRRPRRAPPPATG